MDSQLWAQQHDIGAMRHEERLRRGLEAYQALRGGEDVGLDAAATSESRSRLRILDRLRRRDVAVDATSAEQAI
jgi:hypothetical protein